MLISTIAAAHRILGEIMLLVALAGVILALVGLVRKTALLRTERAFSGVYAGLLDLQALLGIAFYFLLPSAARPTILHPILMIPAVVVVHAGRVWRDNPVPTRHQAQLGVYSLSLVLVLLGRMILSL